MDFGTLARIVICWLVVSCCEGQALRIATYNVENYLIQDRLVEGNYRFEYPKPEAEKGKARETIRRVAPDILGLQEMGDERFLWELENDLEGEGLKYSFRYWMEGEDRERHLAILSKIEAKEVLRHNELSFNYFGAPIRVKRGVLELVFERGNEAVWHLFLVHLKSQYTEAADDPRSELRRMGEATVIRDLIRERMRVYPERGMLVMGDFNDTIGSRALARFLKVGDEPLLRAVEMTDSRGEVWTHFHRAEAVYSRLDYILVNAVMGKQLEEKGGRIEDRVQPYGSDHRLIWVALEGEDSGRNAE